MVDAELTTLVNYATENAMKNRFMSTHRPCALVGVDSPWPHSTVS